MRQSDALRDVIAERERQDAKWGEQNHHPLAYYAILGEEFGELGQAILESVVFDNGRRKEFTPEQLRNEAVQVAAVAVAFIECIDRNFGELLRVHIDTTKEADNA